METRKVFLERGYSSFFGYVCGALGYSESQASERIRAMRLMYEVPEVKAQVARGELSLTAVARLATHSERLQLSAAQVTEILPLLAQQSTRKQERILLQREDAAGIAPRERVKEHARWTELKVALTPQAVALLEEARELDANPGVEIAAILEKALTTYVSAKRHQKQALLKNEKLPRALHVTRQSAPSEPTRQIPRPVRRAVWKRAEGKCEYRDGDTGRVCGTGHALTFEHRTPFSHGGAHTRENLALFCAAHNAYMGEKLFGRRRT